MIQLKNKPCDSSRLTSEYGPRGTKYHNGVDFGAMCPGIEGEPIYAVDDGKIVISKVNGGGIKKGYGNYVAIQHNGYCSLYGHLLKLEVKVGQKVKAGEIIGHMGNTGTSTGVHLHFEIREGNYKWTFFNKKSNGQHRNGVDPTELIKNIQPKMYWIKEMGIKAIKELGGKIDSPDQWIKEIEKPGEIIKDSGDLLALIFVLLSRKE